MAVVTMLSPADLRAICEGFAIAGELVSVAPHGGGYINDTFLGIYQTSKGTRRYIHQRINENVFRKPVEVMENIERVTAYARAQITAAGGDPARETLTLIPTRDGKTYLFGPDGGCWRAYPFIEGTRTIETAPSGAEVTTAAQAFGRFLALLAGLPGPRLHETIPNFHNTPRRFHDFETAAREDRAGRVKETQAEIDFLLRREAVASVVVDGLASGEIPERVTHNDTKLNNVLIDERSGEGICVIDLDTVMPGSSLYDFGDLVRMGAATAAEDETDLDKMRLDLDRFRALAAGFLQGAGSLLVPAERDLLVFGGKLITYEQALRFLMDYLNGDVYYKTRYPTHNLDRARTQIKLVAEMEWLEGEMGRIVKEQTGRLVD